MREIHSSWPGLRAGLSALALGLGFLLAACDSGPRQDAGKEQAAETESERLHAFFERAFEEDLARSPMRQSTLGIKTDYDKWDDISDARAEEDLEIAKARLAELRTFDFDALDASARLSWRLFETLTAREIDNYRWRHHNYPVNQMFGWQQQIPSFLINIHRVSSKSDAEAYIARLSRVGALVDQVIEQMRLREDMGVMPPAFVYPLIIGATRNVITGAPFDESGRDSALFEDFRKKVEALDLPDDEKSALISDAANALTGTLAPAFTRLLAEMERQQAKATTEDGVWKLPDGTEYYEHQLRTYTTTDLSAEDIHRIGLENVARIHDEMRAIMERVGFEGDLQDFFAFMRSDPHFYYPETEEGRARYLAEATALIETMKSRLPEVFGIFPKADLVVKRVEPFRERSAGKAFYQQPALDGSRPGTYYANLYRMADMPTYQMEALAYHEGIPGHHMQIAIAQELEGVPMFQRQARFTAYTEGWGLYSELLPKEMGGFYEDPYSDFGRLAMELWRACRLVVDTGIHAKKWTREQAIDYLRANTPNPEGDLAKAIERYIVMPGQATAYLIGKQKILELREQAREALGEAFDIRAYHDEVLKDGPVPLDILEEKIEAFIARGGKTG
ncbi:MAG: DUF885 domain-containing protein [Rhodothalassiaceae bacterium]